ncbi:MAG: nucleotidyltransferase family protein [Planctomycetes bacterium]|nr:nucleotidyltransferase family protein [Planctomycetota bacterium]
MTKAPLESSTSSPALPARARRVHIQPVNPRSAAALGAGGAASSVDQDFSASSRNIRMMRVLARVAKRFNEAGVPIMALKGAALNLTLYTRADERPMTDLDLLIKPQDAQRAARLLEELGCLRGESLVRDDFFPRFHYEMDYTADAIFPVRIDLHVRPFRPLRYARLIPDAALWERADQAPIGDATVLIPSTEDMLVPLAVPSGVHGNPRRVWLDDIRRWAAARRGEIDWERLLQATRVWRLALPVRRALARVEDEFGPVCPPSVRLRLGELRVNWRDRLALWQAPRDRDHPASHVAVNLLCTPGPRFVLGYLLAMVLPDRGHMGEWYIRRHRGWLACAHLLRWMGPLLRRIPRFWTRLSKIKTGRSAVHGTGVLATREISAGELIARYRGRPVEHDGPYVVWHKTPSGGTRGVELTGKLRFLNHRCRPNADLHEFKLIARTHIGAGREIFIDYGEGTCDCRRVVRQAT